MKLLIVVLSAFLLAGCSGLRERSYGSWLDNVGKPDTRVVPLTAERRKELEAELAQLRTEAEVLRTRLGVEGSRVRRIAYMRELEALGDRLHPIEKVLRDGGYPPLPAA